jgi:MoaA/NifB/PqqE/SkfB family radical SAM enzyme
MSVEGGKRLYLMVNTVVVEKNLKQLPRILRMISGFKAVKHYLVSYPAPEGGACAGYGAMAVDFDELRGGIRGLWSRALSRGITLRFFGIPACVLGVRAEASNDFYYSPRVTVERAVLPGGRLGLKETASWRPTRRRVYLKACALCRFRGSCGGVFRKYLQIFPMRSDIVRPAE